MKYLILCALLLPGMAMAQDAATCQLFAPTQMNFANPYPGAMDQVVYGQIEVDCEVGLPYQLEVQNAGPGGALMLMAPNVATGIPIHLMSSDTRQAWGALNQGEAISGTGTGGVVIHEIEALVELEALPPAGNYGAVVNVMLNF